MAMLLLQRSSGVNLSRWAKIFALSERHYFQVKTYTISTPNCLTQKLNSDSLNYPIKSRIYFRC